LKIGNENARGHLAVKDPDLIKVYGHRFGVLNFKNILD